MTKTSILTLAAVLVVIIFSFGCSKDDDMNDEPMDSCPDEVTYENQVRPILLANCTDSGCHDGNSGVGDWSSYASISPTFTNGRFNNLVIETRQMPQGRTLSSSAYNLLKCWSEQGFPQN